MGQSPEGGYVKGFYKKHNLAVIINEYFGEIGKTRNEYYFEKEKLIFVLEQTSSYPVPIYDSSFDSKQKQITIASQRMYFMNGTLIRWLDKDQNQFKNNPVILNNKTKRVLETVRELKKTLNEKQASL